MPPKERTSTPASAVVSTDLDAQGDGGVGDAGSIHVQVHVELVGSVGDRLDLVDGVEGAELGRLRDRDDLRLHVVNVAPADVGGSDHLWGELAVGGRHVPELAAEETLGRSALVPVDVGILAADDVLPRPQQRLQSGDVGAGAVEDEEHLDLLAEQRPKTFDGLVGVGVFAVGDDMSNVDLGHLGEDVRVDAGVVVAGEAAVVHEGPPE